MNRNDLLTLAQRLREYNHNPHHINPTSEAFHKLIDEAASALSILATPPADAADMGGQAGEEVEVVAHLMRPDFMEPYVSIRRDCSGVFVEQLMTVAQHRRILAQHRQQAGKLVEALRKIHFRADCFVEDDMDMRVPSIKAIVRIAGEALAARDVKP